MTSQQIRGAGIGSIAAALGPAKRLQKTMLDLAAEFQALKSDVSPERRSRISMYLNMVQTEWAVINTIIDGSQGVIEA